MSTTMGWSSLSHGARERIASDRIRPAAPRRFRGFEPGYRGAGNAAAAFGRRVVGSTSRARPTRIRAMRIALASLAAFIVSAVADATNDLADACANCRAVCRDNGAVDSVARCTAPPAK
jgi:hypothetical protein